MKQWNHFYLRQFKLIVPKGTYRCDEALIATALQNLHTLGFTFSSELLARVQTLSNEQFISFYEDLIKNVQQMIGHHVTYQPMYPNFPQEVMDASDVTLFLNALRHYYLGLYPNTEAKPRPPYTEHPELKMLTLGSVEDFERSMMQRMMANSSLSQREKEEIKLVLCDYDNYAHLLPNELPNKENMAFILSILLRYKEAGYDTLSPYIKTATDVLRLAVAYADGDVSLAIPTRFIRLSRPIRRLLLSFLETCGHLLEDVTRYREPWKRLIKELHPFEYEARYPKACEALRVIVEDTPMISYRSEVERLLAERNIEEVARVLSKYPGEYGRRLDVLLRKGKVEDILATFAELASGISTPVLLQIRSHFDNRTQNKPLRVFFPKGDVAKVFALPNTLPKISEEVCNKVVEITEQALLSHFRTFPQLGKVYVSQELVNYPIPFAKRSANTSLRTLSRGSVLPLPEGDTIRFFLYWKEGKQTGRVDIDLSSVLYGEGWKYLDHIDYTALRSKKFKGAHSGDITSAPNGACEFIDLDIPSILAYGGRYIVMNVFSFTEQFFSTLPTCFAGWMMREEPNSGEVFEPRSVIDKLDITSAAKQCLPLILDLKDRTIIWCDIALRKNPYYVNNVMGNEKGIVLMGKAITSLHKPHLYDLFKLHARARGTLVENKDEADIIFSVDEGVTPFQQDEILSMYLC